MNQTRWHILFWIAVTALLTLLFGEVLDSLTLSFYFVSMLLPVAVATSYTFNYWLVPHYLFKKRYYRFALYFCYLLVISVYLEMWVITGSFIYLADLKYENLGPVAGNIFLLAIILYFIVFLKGFLLLTRRAFTLQHRTQKHRAENRKRKRGFITLQADRRLAKVHHDEIHYIESMGDYVKVVSDRESPVIAREALSRLEHQLPGTFLRIHRSYIVNSEKVRSFSKTELEVGGATLPISRTYKKAVSSRLSAPVVNS